jgi:hypothetical protein
MLSRAVHNRLDAPQIRIPSSPPQIISVADCVAKTRFLAADFANECHCFSDSFRKMVETILSEIGCARKQVNFVASGMALLRRWQSVHLHTGLFAKGHFCDTLLWGHRGVPWNARRI